MLSIRPPRPAAILPQLTKRIRPLSIVVMAIVLSCCGTQAIAAPDTSSSTHAAMQNVDYLGGDTASQLNLDFTVLVPSYVPSPFGGEPAIDASGGYYSLYWIVTGGPPTFLQVTGQVGGSLPVGSPYDLNNQLTVNASVQGYEAIHDVTPAYDAVWWIAGGVAYKVESLNMEGIDSLGLANSLIGFVAPDPAPEEPDPQPEPVTEAPDPVDTSIPNVEPEPTVGTENVGPGEPGLDTGQETDSVAPAPGEVAADVPTAGDPAPGDVASGGNSSDGTGTSTVSSDGTGGPEPPVVGTDGTGGTSDLSLTP